VKRGAVDVNAAKTVFDLLKKGEILGIFPQGTRSKDPANPVKARHGVAKFAADADVPVVPVALYGKFRIFGKAYIKYGKPVKIEKKADGTPYSKAEYTEIAQKLVDGIYAMMTEDDNGNNKG
jgi:1-acyl-sn-glycerol-3-phosphate acyltransferase